MRIADVARLNQSNRVGTSWMHVEESRVQPVKQFAPNETE